MGCEEFISLTTMFKLFLRLRQNFILGDDYVQSFSKVAIETGDHAHHDGGGVKNQKLFAAEGG
jgi:hypothetical protein